MNDTKELLDAKVLIPSYWFVQLYYWIIPCALVFGFYLCYFNDVYLQYKYKQFYEGWIQAQEYALLSILCGFVISLIPKFGTAFYRKWIYLITFCLILSELFLGQKSYEIKTTNDRIMAYYKLNCEEQEEQFEIDKIAEDFVFWVYGYETGSRSTEQKFKDEYNLEVIVIRAGCTIGAGRCYNELLLEYIGEKYKK